MKIAVIYWTMTGNTEAMAYQVAAGVKEAGSDASVFSVSEFDVASASDYDGFALGCPAMGAEELDTGEFEPMYRELIPTLQNKKVVIFGSYDWGDGEWLRTWAQDCADNGITLAAEPLQVHLTPDAEGETACQQLGKDLVA